MPISFEIDTERRVVYLQFRGPVSMADIRGNVVQIVQDPRFTPGVDVLADIRGIEDRFTSAETVQHGAWRQQWPRFGKMAIVAATDYEFGVARMFEMGTNVSGGAEMRTFRSMQDARQWLALPGA